MKYIKKYEVTNFDTKKFIDKTDKKRDEYKKYIGKYIVFNNINNNKIGKLISEDTQYYFRIDVYDYDNIYKGYNVSPRDFHIITFDIIKSFDTFAEAKEGYEIVENSNKYNL